MVRLKVLGGVSAAQASLETAHPIAQLCTYSKSDYEDKRLSEVDDIFSSLIEDALTTLALA